MKMIDTPRCGEKNAHLGICRGLGHQTLTTYSLAGNCDWASWPLGLLETPDVKTLT